MAINIEAVTRTAINYAEDVRRALPVDKVMLFGSYAKGTATELSDVDIGVFLKDFNGRKRTDITTELLGLGWKYNDFYLEPHVFPSSELYNDNPFVKEILRTGREL
jgi:predicted nucleotidyltransferase